MADSPEQNAQVWLEKLIALSGFSITVENGLPKGASERLLAFGSHWLTLTPENLSAEQLKVVLGENHQVLDAMQYLLNSTLHLTQDNQEMYTLELDGQREHQYLKLLDMAEAVAQQVRDSGQEVEMQPLSAAERRLVHTILADTPDLETYSRGQEPQRRLVVCPAGEKPEES
jgi:spoIIIJ-associated protein